MKEIVQKQCGKCQQHKELDEFHKGSGKHGRVSYCKPCIKEYRRENKERVRRASKKWRKNNPKYMKEYYGDNKEYRREQNKQYAAEHKEEARERSREWKKNNPERKKQNDRELYQRKKEIYAKQAKQQYEKNQEHIKQKVSQYKKENPGKVNANIAKRRAAKKQATPKWADLKKIELLYVEARDLTVVTGTEYEVDHYYPLTSDVVCGLHCEDNLRIITAEENNRKKCKLLE